MSEDTTSMEIPFGKLILNPNAAHEVFVIEWILRMPNEAADSILVEMAAHEMREKLAKKRKEGRGGWFAPSCSSARLKNMMMEHIEKGDYVDVLNLAAMILARQKLFGESA